MKKEIKGIVSKLIGMIFVVVIIYSSVLGKAQGQQYMKQLDYQVTLNQDGSMNVVETWDINIINTNTIFKNFDLSNKFGEITDVKVVDLKTGKELKQIDTEMYHVIKDCYYALPIKNNKQFEIAWGVGLDNTYANKKYQVSYKVTNVISQYKDIQEFYWQFLAKRKNDIPVSKVTGTVKLPQEVTDIENLYVWGHGQINGKIEKVSKNKVSFEMKQLNPKSMLEIRVITKDFLFQVDSAKVKDYNYLNTVLREETRWADEANQERWQTRKFLIVVVIIYLVIIAIVLMKIRKYKKIGKERNTVKLNKLEYFREIPREETATPAEATYLYNYKKRKLKAGTIQSQMVASNILNLALKKAIELRIEDEEVFIKLTNKQVDLKKDELAILGLLKDIIGKDEVCDIRELKSYARRKYDKYSVFINKVVNEARESLYKLKLIDKAEEREYKKCESVKTNKSLLINSYEFFAVLYAVALVPIFKMTIIGSFGIGFLPTFLEILLMFLPIAILLIYTWNLQEKVKNKIAVLTTERK